MTTKTLQAWTAGCGTAIMVRLATTFGVLLVMALCMGSAALVPLPPGVNRDYVEMGGFALAAVGLVAAALVFAVVFIRQRGRKLDAAFAPLNMAGQRYLTNGRQYHGSYRGRQVDTYFYRGPVLEMYMGTRLQTRLGIARHDGVGRAVAGFLGRQPLALDDPHWAGFNVYALDEGWSRAVLADARVRDTLRRLIDEEAPGAGRFEFRQAILQPEAWLLRLQHTRIDSITAENVHAWLNDLHALAEATEALPPPQATAAPTVLERRGRANRGAFLLPSVLIVAGLLAALFIFSLVLVLMFLLNSQ